MSHNLIGKKELKKDMKKLDKASNTKLKIVSLIIALYN